MERKTKFLIFTGMLSVTILAGCLENDETQTENSGSEITVAEAQKSFESSAKTFHLSPSEVTRKADEELLSIPLWAKASVLDFEKRKIVEVPIEGPSEFMHMKQNPNDSISQKRHWCNTAIRLIAEKSTNGDIFFTIARITVGGDYLKRHKKRPLSVSFSTIKDFSGIVRYYSLDGELISGRKYDKGKVIGTISPCDSTRTIAQTRSQEYVCEMVEVEHYKYYCTDTYLGGELIQTTCEEVDSWTEWEEQCEWVDVPDVVCPNCGENPCICGQGGGDGGDPNPGEGGQETLITLSSTANEVEAPNKYDLNVSIKNAKKKVIKVTYEMNRSTRGTNWRAVYEDTPSGYSSTYTRIAWTPGFWQVKALVDFGTEIRESNVISVEERYPSRSSFENNALLKNHLSTTLWNMAVQFADNNKSTSSVREYGCFIYLRRNGTYYAGTTIEGPIIAMTAPGLAGSVNFSYNDTPYNPDMEDVDLLVGTLHTHYPLTWVSNKIERPVGASQVDINASLPGLGYDYVKTLFGGHNINAQKDFFIHGPIRRDTTN